MVLKFSTAVISFLSEFLANVLASLIRFWTLFLAVFLVPFVAYETYAMIQIEAQSGPHFESSSSIIGLSDFLDSDDLLVASKRDGLFLWHPRTQTWESLLLKAPSTEILSLNVLAEETLIFFNDGTGFSLPRRAVPFALRSFKPIPLTKALSFVQDCGKVRFAAEGDRFFRVNPDWTLHPFKTGSMRVRAVGCRGDEVLLGTEDHGVVKCSLKALSCDPDYYRIPFSHVRAVSWNSVRRSWIIGIYGDTYASLVEIKNRTWQVIGKHLGDVLQLVHSPGKSYPSAITELGMIYENIDGDWKPITVENTLAAPALRTKDGSVVGSHAQMLVKLDNKRDLHHYRFPFNIKNGCSLRAPVGNTLVWDILSLKNGFVFAATSQTGIWWSSNGGVTWDPMNEGLEGRKVHFIKFNDKNNKLIAGTHGKGLYSCQLPCKEWKKVKNPRLDHVDFKSAIPVGADSFLLGTGQGAFIYDLSTEEVQGPYILKNRESQLVADFWTTSQLGGKYFFGIYPRYGNPTGVWEFNLKTHQFIPFIDLPVAVTGLEQVGDQILVSSLSGLYSCLNNKCEKINSLSITRMTRDGERIWLAAHQGLFEMRTQNLKSSFRQLSAMPSQMVIPLLDASKSSRVTLMLGTLKSGAVRMSY